MLDPSAENPARKPAGCSPWVSVALLILPLVGLLLTPGSSVLISARKTAAREVTLQVAAAINSYKTEYGHLPRNRPDGRYEDAAGNAQIFAALRALDAEQNPRRITYFEYRNVKVRQDLLGRKIAPVDGFDPQTGVLLDPFGQPYRIRVMPRLEMHAESPYVDVPAFHSEVIVWSTGPDGKQGNPNDPRKFAGSDDIYQGLP